MTVQLAASRARVWCGACRPGCQGSLTATYSFAETVAFGYTHSGNSPPIHLPSEIFNHPPTGSPTIHPHTHQSTYLVKDSAHPHNHLLTYPNIPFICLPTNPCTYPLSRLSAHAPTHPSTYYLCAHYLPSCPSRIYLPSLLHQPPTRPLYPSIYPTRPMRPSFSISTSPPSHSLLSHATHSPTWQSPV